MQLVAGTNAHMESTVGVLDVSSFKGLEADIVIFVAGSYQPIDKKTLYVAFSRATTGYLYIGFGGGAEPTSILTNFVRGTCIIFGLCENLRTCTHTRSIQSGKCFLAVLVTLAYRVPVQGHMRQQCCTRSRLPLTLC